MTATPAGSPSPDLFSFLSVDRFAPYRTQRETFALSMLGQGLILALLVYFTSCVIRNPPSVIGRIPSLEQLPLIFSGSSGGGGGGHEKLSASLGRLPKSSLDYQLVPPTVKLPTAMPKLPAEETVMIAPEIKLPPGAQVGDPTSAFTTPSNGPGGPGGIGPGCCDGIGPSEGPGAGPGPAGIFPAGKQGVTVPVVIYNPEPSFSDEARKAKTQGVVLLMVIVGKDGRTYGIRVGQSLGMGLDEKAIEAVSRWRFKPATLNGQAVATQIAVEVNFRLY